jgi:hypothetical protein
MGRRMEENERNDEPPHDVLAAEAFAVGAGDPALHREPAHDVLAADEFPVPAAKPHAVPPEWQGTPASAPPLGQPAPRRRPPRRALAAGIIACTALLLIRRRRRRRD